MKWTWSVCTPCMSYCSFSRALTGVLKQDFSTDSGVVGAFSEDAPPLPPPPPPPMTSTEPRDEEASTVVATAEASRSCRVTGRFTALNTCVRFIANLLPAMVSFNPFAHTNTAPTLCKIHTYTCIHTYTHELTCTHDTQITTLTHTRHTTHHPHTHTHSCKPDRYSSRQ